MYKRAHFTLFFALISSFHSNYIITRVTKALQNEEKAEFLLVSIKKLSNVNQCEILLYLQK